MKHRGDALFQCSFWLNQVDLRIYFGLECKQTEALRMETRASIRTSWPINILATISISIHSLPLHTNTLYWNVQKRLSPSAHFKMVSLTFTHLTPSHSISFCPLYTSFLTSQTATQQQYCDKLQLPYMVMLYLMGQNQYL